jgi:processive 1,2-diacylglycerol beta-glucosyltransferase
MDELYSIADIYITKPGGLSVSEALRWQLPILVSHLLPGQEQHNFKYLLANGLVMPKSNDIVSQALEELETGRFRQALKHNGKLNKLFNGQDILLEGINLALANQDPS